MTANEFVKMVRAELKKKGGRIILQNRRTLKDDLSSVGEFYLQNGAPIIVAARNNSGLLSVMVHEFGHFQHSHTKVWAKNQENKFTIEEIIGDSSLRNYIMSYLLVELDCERRVLKLIDKYDLPINKIQYIKEANLVLYKYIGYYYFGEWLPTTDQQFANLSELMSPELVNLRKLKSSGRRMYGRLKEILNN